VRVKFAAPIACLLVVATPAALAQDTDALATRSLAATCASCHGTDGHAVRDSRVPALAGQPRDALLQRLRAFRDGSRPSTIMGQLAKGFSDAQLAQLASYFAAQPK